MYYSLPSVVPDTDLSLTAAIKDLYFWYLLYSKRHFTNAVFLRFFFQIGTFVYRNQKLTWKMSKYSTYLYESMKDLGLFLIFKSRFEFGWSSPENNESSYLMQLQNSMVICKLCSKIDRKNLIRKKCNNIHFSYLIIAFTILWKSNSCSGVH